MKFGCVAAIRTSRSNAWTTTGTGRPSVTRYRYTVLPANSRRCEEMRVSRFRRAMSSTADAEIEFRTSNMISSGTNLLSSPGVGKLGGRRAGALGGFGGVTGGAARLTLVFGGVGTGSGRAVFFFSGSLFLVWAWALVARTP